MQVSRRLSLFLFSLGLTPPALSRPRLGDQEWMLRFKVFVKCFNDFVDALDDNKLDHQKWARLRSAWHALETDV